MLGGRELPLTYLIKSVEHHLDIPHVEPVVKMNKRGIGKLPPVSRKG
jgi:hypothetical protein